MTRLVGLGDGDEAVAVVVDDFTGPEVVEVEVAGVPHVVLWTPGQASALDTSIIDSGREVGQTAVFDARLDGVPLELVPGGTEGRFEDRVSGSTFDLRGRALDGPLEGRQLRAVAHDDTFWFAWVAFQPDTEVVVPDGGTGAP